MNAIDRKVLVGAACGGLVTFGAWLLHSLNPSLTLTAEAALGLSTALTFIVQYLVPNAAPQETTDEEKKG